MSDRAVTRVRHELRLRLVDVVKVSHPGPRLIRVTVGGEQLRGFASPGFDDHVKLFVPPDGGTIHSMPAMGPGGPVFEAGAAEPEMRDYTPGKYDPAALTLQIDFALHDAGPATAWARRARTGDRLIIGGPRGSFLVGTGFDWHLLMGDDTALPAIRRRLAELPEGSRAVVFAEVHGPEDEEPFESRAEVEVHGLHRTCRDGRPSRLLDALAGARLPEGDCYAWVACESADARAVRAALLDRGVDRAALKASGYWRRGVAATHEVHDRDGP